MDTLAVVKHEQAFNALLVAGGMSVALPGLLKSLYNKRNEEPTAKENKDYKILSDKLFETERCERIPIIKENINGLMPLVNTIAKEFGVYSLKEKKRLLDSANKTVNGWLDVYPSFLQTPFTKHIMLFIRLPDALETWNRNRSLHLLVPSEDKVKAIAKSLL